MVVSTKEGCVVQKFEGNDKKCINVVFGNNLVSLAHFDEWFKCIMEKDNLKKMFIEVSMKFCIWVKKN